MKNKILTLGELLADETMTPQEKYHYYINKSAEWKQVKKAVLQRDEYACQCCGRTDEETILSVHHRCYDSLFQESNNNYKDLITLCKVCHFSIHQAKSNINRFKLQKWV